MEAQIGTLKMLRQWLSVVAINVVLSTGTQAAVLEPEADCPSVFNTLSHAQVMFAGKVLSTSNFGIVDIDFQPSVLGLKSSKSGLAYYVVTFEVLHTYKLRAGYSLPTKVLVLETWRCEPCSISDVRNNAPAVGETYALTALPSGYRSDIPQLHSYNQVITELSNRLPFAFYEDILCNRFSPSELKYPSN